MLEEAESLLVTGVVNSLRVGNRSGNTGCTPIRVINGEECFTPITIDFLTGLVVLMIYPLRMLKKMPRDDTSKKTVYGY